MAQKAPPTLQVLLLAFGYAENVPKTIRPDANRHQHRYIPHFARPAALEHHPIQIHVRKLTGDLSIAPGFDVLINLLVKPADGPRTDPRAPPGFGNVLHSAHTYPGQIH